MKKIVDINELENGKELYMFVKGEFVKYRFLCVHPNYGKCVILTDMLDNPVRFTTYELYDRFYIDCSRSDMLKMSIEYYKDKVHEYEESLKDIENHENRQ